MGRRDNAMRRRAGAQSKQQRGVEGEPMQRRRDPASIETISYANLRMVHVPPHLSSRDDKDRDVFDLK